MVRKAIAKLKSGKAPGPSGITSEMIKAGGVYLVRMLTNLINEIIRSQSIPNDWNDAFIINCYKGKGDSLERGNYRGLKLLELVMKILERILDNVIRQQVSIDNMQFGFMPGRSTTDAIFILRHMQEKHLSKKKNLYMGFIDLEKAFDRVPRQVLWWAMRKVGVEEWIIDIVKAMYSNSKSRVRVNGSYSDQFDVRVGVHQGSVLSPLLFIIVMEAISREFHTGCPWELLYADNLPVIVETVEELVSKIELWKSSLESYGLRVNMKKTKVMCSSNDVAGPEKNISTYPCGVCCSNVGRNSIVCSSCLKWVHKRCSGISGRLMEDPTYICPRCAGTCRAPPPEKLIEHLECGGGLLEAVKTFCYLGDTIGQSGGCGDAINARIQSSWKAFRALLPILTNRGISLNVRGHLLDTCVLTVLLYSSETWAVNQTDQSRLERNINSMVRWVCGVSLNDKIPSVELYSRLGIQCVDRTLRWNRLRFYGHMLRHPNTYPSSVLNFELDTPYPKGRPKLRWLEVIDRDLKKLNIDKTLADDRQAWKLAINPAKRNRNLLQPSSRRKRRIIVE